MRMWMLPTKFLCRKHLLGEHGEIHKHRHNFEKKHKISGRIKPIVLIEPSSMKHRHDALSLEMVRRGYNHLSDYILPDLEYLPDEERNAKANISYNLVNLANRCKHCKRRIKKYWRKYGNYSKTKRYYGQGV